MRIQRRAAVLAALCLLATTVQANGNDNRQGFGPCREGFADGTEVTTESRGVMTIGQVQVDDRVWSFNQGAKQAGWSKVLRRVDEAKHYRLLVDFTAPGSDVVTKACWLIERGSQPRERGPRVIITP